MTFYPNKLLEIIDARGLTVSQAASMGGVSTNRFNSVLEGSRIPTINQVKRLADNLAVPYYAFFSKSFEVEKYTILDLRGSEQTYLQLGAYAKSIVRNIRIRDFYADLFNRIDRPAPDKLRSIETDENPEQLAQSIRNELEIDNYQKGDLTKKEFFNIIRIKVQKLGVFVTVDHNISNDIDGFALFHENFTANYIFINSSVRNSGRKSFTLAHELAHIIGKRSAVSNDYEYDNEIESFCNKFASSLLLPRSQIFQEVEDRRYKLDTYSDAVHAANELSQIFKVSISSVLVRFQELGLTKRDYYKEFSKNFGSPDHLDSAKKSKMEGHLMVQIREL